MAFSDHSAAGMGQESIQWLDWSVSVVVLFVVRLSRKLGWSSLGTSLFQFQGFFQRVSDPEDIQLGMGDRASAAVLGSLLGQIFVCAFL